MIETAYLIYGEDFEQRNWIDRLKSHVMGVLPPHRFKGSLDFNQNEMVFEGWDSYADDEVSFRIRKVNIVQLYHGYDQNYSTFQTRGMGIGWAPIRISIQEKNDEGERQLYLIAEFNGVFSANAKVFEEMKSWLS